MSSLWWATTLVLRPHNSTTAAKSCREPFLLPPTTTASHQKFLSNPCRSRPNKWQRNRSSATAVFKTGKLFSTVLPPKFSPFLNDIKLIKGRFPTFVWHFAHDWTIAPTVYRYKAKKELSSWISGNVITFYLRLSWRVKLRCNRGTQRRFSPKCFKTLF